MLPSDTDIKMMRIALQHAHAAADMGEVPVGAVIYRGNEILAEGHNLRETTQDPVAHAEMLVLKAAAQKVNSWRLDDCSMAVTLEPCPMCAGAIINARLSKLVYGALDPKMGCVDSLYHLVTDLRFNHRVSVIPNVIADECGRVLKEFFKHRRSDSPPPKPYPTRDTI
ncbi:MAG: nucleoside deaminase [Phycisphaeraceae bacterium]|nr:nucleoside deaminase [Phycisphaeraceae bacterium]